jgi:hypothetical protein
MAKKIAPGIPKPTLKQRAQQYRSLALTFINDLRYPKTKQAFSVTTYSKDKKPTMLSAPELGAIVGTARGLGYKILLSLEGQDEGSRLVFTYAEDAPETPFDLRKEF